MRIRITVVAAVVLLVGSVWPGGQRRETSAPMVLQQQGHRHTEICRLIAVPGDAFTFVPPPAPEERPFYGPTAATFNVTYVGFGAFPAAQAAFQHAVNIWAGLITSPVTINVSATFTSLGPGVLGSAGPNFIRANFNGSVPSTWYGDALADKLQGTDLGGGAFDIVANFNSDFANWYFGTNGATPAGQYDFVSVVLHELGHGLGFFGSATVSGIQGGWGFGGLPIIYDRFALTETNAPILTAFANPSTALGTQLRQAFNPSNPRGPGVYFGGASAQTANGGLSARLYTPTIWSPGSSYSHLDENTYPPGNPNSLMTYALGSAEAIHSPGPVTLGMFDDMGWAAACAPSLNVSSAIFTSAGGTGTVTVTNGEGCAWTATSNSAFLSITDGSSGSGNGIVSYNVAANPGSTDRMGTLTIAGLTFTVTQTSNSGGISGTVTGTGGVGLASVGVFVYSASGVLVESGTTNGSGQYSVSGLSPGTYFAHTYNLMGYLDELYDNLPCPYFSCLNGVASGTPITVAAGSTTTGINFALALGGNISGTVTGAGGLGLTGISIYVWNTSGGFAATTSTNASGQYTVSGLLTGTYFASTSSSAGYIDEVYDNQLCLPYCDTTAGTPIAVTLGATTGGIDFALALGGSISGAVTGVGSAGLNNVSVWVYNTSGSFVRSAMTSGTGQYTVSGLPSGTYFARTSNSDNYHDELYNNLPCFSFCEVTDGTPITVTAGATTMGIDFALVLGARISGTVTGVGGVGLSDVFVEIYNASGSLITSTSTDETGQYASGASLTAGTYFARTSNSSPYFNELYNNLPCSSLCDVTDGTPIVLAAGATATGIDFTLALGGNISGTVTGVGGVGVIATVTIFDTSGSFVAQTFTNVTGQYTVGGLPAGNYFALTDNSGNYLDELYDNVPCASVCDVTTGALIAVTAGEITSGIDFVLALGGNISGTVTGVGGVGLNFVPVDIYDASGSFVTFEFTNPAGEYTASGLPTGNYFARTSNSAGYLDEVYDNLPCVFCNPTTGTPIAVTAGATTSGIDFTLTLGGSISGRVTGIGGIGLSDVEVEIYDASGLFVAASGFVNADGEYTSNVGLPTGTYLAIAYSAAGYVDELYNNIPCPGTSCDVTTGTPIAVTAGAATTGIDFVLAVGGSISGTVTDTGGVGLSGVGVEIFNASGSFVTSGFTNATGQYTLFTGLPTGTYFARTRNFSGYIDQLYDNVPCAGGACDETAGTPITVTAGATTSGIDFTLAPGGRIRGTVTGTGGVGLGGVYVTIYDASGTQVDSNFTITGGQYTSLTGLSPTGTYFARTQNWAGYVDEVYNNVPCPGGSCDVTTGTPISVTAGTITTGINFALTTPGTMTLTPATLNFAGTNTGGTLSPITPPQTVTVAFDNGATDWSASANQPWVQLTGASGTGSGTFTVGIINPGGVLPTNVLSGQVALNATITLTANVGNSPQTVTVNLNLQPGSAFAPPIGLVDTPLQNASGQVGAIGVTGWVVDDVGVASVQIYRNCLAFEPAVNCQLIKGHNVVFIGNATLVPGARPDIEAIYPSYPAANVGAWGYLLLTSMLPHVPNAQLFGGQGPLTLYAFATDLDGHMTQLGRTQVDTTPTSITMNNDNIAKPFGAIDTPTQGQTIAGTVVNFGWALTPDSDTVAGAGDILVPTDGSTSLVYIDGAPVGNVSYNQCRGVAASGLVPGGVFCDDDVSNIFGNPTPQAPFTTRTENVTRHRNLDAGRGPIGAYILDTTTLSNGLHTIMWGITDSAGRGDGIGSRFINVLNGSSLTANVLMTAATETLGPAEELAAWPIDARSVWARQGVDVSRPWEEVTANGTGQRAVRMPAQGRLEVWLGEAPVVTGYLVANGTIRPLPPGSRLDAATGIFTWHPLLGYLYTYQLTFLRQDGTQVPLTVTLEPARGATGHLEVAINRPAADARVSGAFTVEGWALDTGAWQGAGVGTVHVWAQRVDVPAASPEFLGAATLNGTRSDVAAIYGAQFEHAGWALSVAGLAPGTYDVTAYVWRTRTQQFEDARTVRMTVR